jgi:hypothetical protein
VKSPRASVQRWLALAGAVVPDGFKLVARKTSKKNTSSSYVDFKYFVKKLLNLGG